MKKNLIFIVAYNHEDKIENVVGRIPISILEDPLNEVLIIDDASRDHTFMASNRIQARFNYPAKLIVLKNPVNQGYGGNQKLGYRYAIDQGFERVFLIHGDGQYAPELLCDFINEYEKEPKPDAVFGTRMASWSSPLKGGMPLYKFLGNKILTTMQNKILKSNFSEFHSGYRSYSTDLLSQIPFEANSNDFHFDTEIIIQCLALGAKIVELPIPTHYGDEVCHVNGFEYARNVLKVSMRFQIQQMGFLYDRKFDVETNEYPYKGSPYSSHTKVAERIAPFSRVLDIGCGRGSIAKLLLNKGCIVDGVDILPPEEIEVPLRKYHRIDLIKNLPALAKVLEENEYEYIVMADVIEHMAEPEYLLDVVRSSHRIQPRPTIVASTSNVAFFIIRMMLASGQFNYGKRGILDRTHTRLFTKDSFRRIFEQCGFTVHNESGICLPLSVIFGEASQSLEAVADKLAKAWPSLTAYQLILSAQPLPTTSQLLAISANYSEDLRTHEQTHTIEKTTVH